MPAENGFRFLTMEEFGRLSRRDKVAYLERAAEEINKQQLGTDTLPSLFRDGPPRPARGSPREDIG